MVTTMSALRTAATTDGAPVHPAATARSIATGAISNASTSRPALARLAAMPAPMWPRPMNAISFMELDRLAKLIDELIGVTTDGFIEHQGGAGIGRVAQDVALAFEDEAGRGHFFFHLRRVDPVGGVGVGQPRAIGRRMIHHDVFAAGLEGLEHR